jgi:hypothetical protein
MKTLMSNSMRFFGWSAMLALIVFSCNRDDEMSSALRLERANRAGQDNSEIIASSQDVMGITEGVFVDEGISDGRATTGGRIENGEYGDDDGLSGCPVKISGSFDMDNTHMDTVIFSGDFTIDFGDGSGCPDSTHVKKGKLTDTFNFTFGFKPRFHLISSSQIIAFEEFSRGGKVIDGTFTVKTQAPGTKFLEIQNVTITYPDGTSASVDGTLTSVDHNFETLNRGDDTRTLTGELSGHSRDGVEFSANITTEVLFKFACFKRRDIPVSGIVNITTDGTSSTLDFGDGRCDKVYTVTSGGTSTEHSL